MGKGLKGSLNFVQGSNFTIAQIVLKAVPMYSSSREDSENVQFDLSAMYRSPVIKEKVKSQILGPTGVKNTKML